MYIYMLVVKLIMVMCVLLRLCRATLISDLETAEARLDNHLTTMDRVKNAK